MKKILFVCLGNICRSPLAQGVAQKIIDEKNLDIVVDSAGTGSWHEGENPCSRSIKVARKNGVDISNLIARQVEDEDFKKFDLIIGLDQSNIENLKNLGCKNPIKLRYFDGSNDDVPDPYFFDDFDGFDKVYKMIEICVKNLLDEISKT